jgi:hypothetical protein
VAWATSWRWPDQPLIPLTVKEIRHLFAKLITNTAHTISQCVVHGWPWASETAAGVVG